MDLAQLNIFHGAWPEWRTLMAEKEHQPLTAEQRHRADELVELLDLADELTQELLSTA